MNPKRPPHPKTNPPLFDELRRFMIKKRHSRDYRDVQLRRLKQLHRQAFPLQLFWDAHVDDAEVLALDWMGEQEELGRTDQALDNYAKLINLLARAAGHRGLVISYRLRAHRRRRIALDVDRIRQLLESYRNPDARIEARNRAILVVSLLVAERRGEVSRMDLDHVNRDLGCVRVLASKNQLDAWVPVHPDLWQYLQAWLDVRPSPEEDVQALFTSIRRPHKRLAPTGVYSVMKAISKATGVYVNNTITRHTRGRRLKLAGYTDEEIMHLFRQTDQRSPSFYTEFGFEDLQRAVAMRGDPGLFDDPLQLPCCITCKRPVTPTP